MVLLDGSRCCNPCLCMYLPVPSLYLSDFYDIFFFLVCFSFYESMQCSRSCWSAAGCSQWGFHLLCLYIITITKWHLTWSLYLRVPRSTAEHVLFRYNPISRYNNLCLFHCNCHSSYSSSLREEKKKMNKIVFCLGACLLPWQCYRAT